MKMSNSIRKVDTIDYYSIVSGKQPGRAPSIFHREYKYYWCEFPQAPVYSIYNTRFYTVPPLAHSVDCSTYGQIHFWARTGTLYCPTLVVVSFTPQNEIKELRYYFYNGLEISLPDGSFGKVAAPDKEEFDYCLSAFLKHYLSDKYSLNSYWKGVLLQSSDLLIS
jgi:hypothetical protein